MAKNKKDPNPQKPAATAHVHLWGEKVGVVREYANGRIGFSYEPPYLPGGRSISPKHLPLENRVFEFPELRPMDAFLGLPGALADSLPDAFGNKLIQHYFDARGERDKALSPVQRLLYIGSRAMGALEYTPAMQRKTPQEEQSLEIQALVEQARLVIEGTPDDAIKEIMQVSASAGGARAKALVLWNQAENRIRSGFAKPQPGDAHWMVKFDGVGSANKLDRQAMPFNRVEYTYALIAKQLGIQMADEITFKEETNGLFHFMIKRFDRTDAGKIHMHSLGGITHVDFNRPQSFSYEGWFRLINEMQLGQEAMEQAFLRMAFNIVGRNQDDHVKNISFLMDRDGGWRLAPAYDLTFAAGRGYTAQHQMTLGGVSDGFTREMLEEAGRKFSIKHPGKVIDSVVDAFAGWPKLAREYSVPNDQIQEISGRQRINLGRG